MVARNETILVTGATGQQGGAVARALLHGGWKVRALVRDTARGRKLADLGAELVAGDLNDPPSVQRALVGCHGCFSVQTYFTPEGVSGEIRQGKLLADLASKAGIRHFVYSSVVDAEKHTGVPHFDSKAQIERHVLALGLPATILRAVFYYENFIQFFTPALENGTYVIRVGVHPDTRLAMIAVSDIGWFAADAFSRSDQYLGRAVEVAGDVLTMPQVAERMQARFGKPFRFEPLPIEAVRSFSADLALMFEWFIAHGQQVDLPALKKCHPGLMDFSAWLRNCGWDPTKARMEDDG